MVKHPQLKQFSKFTCIFFFLSIVNICAQPFEDQPDQVIILFRHGSRGPTTNTYDPSWPSYLLAELTPTGMRQQFTLGTQLREEYSYLVPEYDPDNFYVRSTDLNRTIMSAESFLLGFFPFGSGPNISNLNSELDIPPYNISDTLKSNIESLESVAEPFNYIPIPIHVIELAQDYLLYSFDSEACPLAPTMKASAQQSEEQIQFQILMNSTLNEIINMTNDTTFNFQNLGKFWETMHCDIYAGKQIPSKYVDILSNSDLWRNLSFIHNYMYFDANAGSQKQVQLFSMNYFNEMMGSISNFSQGLQTPNLLVYSASDTTMVPLLTALNITNTDCLMSNFLNQTNISSCVAPDFAAQLIVEFYNNSDPNQSEIAVYYNDYLQNICSTANGRCSMNGFFEVLNTITQYKEFDYYVQQCNNITNGTTIITYNITLRNVRDILICVTGLIASALLVIIVQKHKIFRRTKYSADYYKDFPIQLQDINN